VEVTREEIEAIRSRTEGRVQQIVEISGKLEQKIIDAEAHMQRLHRELQRMRSEAQTWERHSRADLQFLRDLKHRH